MKVLLTGSSGRIGRAIFNALIPHHAVTGLDRSPFSTTSVLGDVADAALLRTSLQDVDAVVHTASLHAPHVGMASDAEFHRVNVEGLQTLCCLAKEAGVKRIVYTSTTALYGEAIAPGACTWVDETLPPHPKTIYHRTKLDAERILESEACATFPVSVLRMSRCFPEQAHEMAAYRLHRGIDARDVADAHCAALLNGGEHFQRYIVSGKTPFHPCDTDMLATNAIEVLNARCPELVVHFQQRQWPLPRSIDRVYSPHLAEAGLGWSSALDYSEVLRQADNRSLEVLPRSPHFRDRTTE